MDEHRHPGHRGQHPLRLVEPAAVPHLDTAREPHAAIARGIVRGHDDAGHPFGREQPGDLRQRQGADGVLAAGHRDGAVVQQLVGDVDAGGHGGTDGERTGVVEGAVAEVLHEVLGVDERGHPDPLGALAAHLGQPGHLADLLVVHQQHHGVTADARADQRARRHGLVEVLCGQPEQK